MPEYVFYQVDAFASQTFEGNQACVIPMADFLPDTTLLAIAAENNVAETAFIVPLGEGRWKLRWFTPTVEVPLCGHATLAAAHVLFRHEGFTGNRIVFETVKSSELTVERSGNGYEMDFPCPEVFETAATDEVSAALGARPIAAYGGPFYAAIFETPEDVLALTPDLKTLAQLGIQNDEKNWERGNFGCMALGGEGVDVTSRFFAPGSGIDEDPATGSWHCMLAAVVKSRFGSSELACYQAFPGRGGRIGTRVEGDRVKLTGEAVTVIRGQFTL